MRSTGGPAVKYCDGGISSTRDHQGLVDSHRSRIWQLGLCMCSRVERSVMG